MCRSEKIVKVKIVGSACTCICSNKMRNTVLEEPSQAKSDIHEIYQAPTKDAAYKAFDRFVEVYQAKYPKATDKLITDRDALLAFYAFPAEHWVHLRTTNPIESTFATVRHRTKVTKGPGSRAAGVVQPANRGFKKPCVELVHAIGVSRSPKLVGEQRRWLFLFES